MEGRDLFLSDNSGIKKIIISIIDLPELKFEQHVFLKNAQDLSTLDLYLTFS